MVECSLKVDSLSIYSCRYIYRHKFLKRLTASDHEIPLSAELLACGILILVKRGDDPAMVCCAALGEMSVLRRISNMANTHNKRLCFAFLVLVVARAFHHGC